MDTHSRFFARIDLKESVYSQKDIKNYCFFHDLIVNPLPYRYLQSAHSSKISEEDLLNLVNPRTQFYLCKKMQHSTAFERLPQYVLKRVAYFKASSRQDELKMRQNQIQFKNYDQIATQFHCLQLAKGSHRVLQLKAIVHQNTKLRQDKLFFYQSLKLPDRRSKQIKNICFILQQMNGGSLSEYIARQNNFTQEQIAEYSCQIAEGLIQLQSMGIIHRDLRPQNILFHNKQIKFADFDAAFIKDYSDYRNIKNGVDKKDTTPYEIMMLMTQKEQKLRECSSEELYNMQKKADIYFLGVNMYSMIFCQMFESFNHRYINILANKKKRQGFCQKLLDLMVRCLQKNPQHRIELSQVVSILSQIQRQFYLKSSNYKRVYLSAQPLNLHSFSSNQIEQKLKSQFALQKTVVSHKRQQMERMIYENIRQATVQRKTSFFKNLFKNIISNQDSGPLWYKKGKLNPIVIAQTKLQERIQNFLQKLQIKAYYYQFIFCLLCEVNLACVKSQTHFENIRSHIELFSSQLVVLLTFIYEAIMKRPFTTDINYEKSNPGYQNRRVITNMRVFHSRWQFFSGRLRLQKEENKRIKQLKKVLEQFYLAAQHHGENLRQAQLVEEKYKIQFRCIKRIQKLQQLILKFKETRYNSQQERLYFEYQEKNLSTLMHSLESEVKREMVQTIISLILAYQETKSEEWGHRSNLKNAIFMLMILQAQATQKATKNDFVLIKEQLTMMINLKLGWNSSELSAFFHNYTQTHTQELIQGFEELQSRISIQSLHDLEFKIEINHTKIHQDLKKPSVVQEKTNILINEVPKQAENVQKPKLMVEQTKNENAEQTQENFEFKQKERQIKPSKQELLSFQKKHQQALVLEIID